MDALRDSWKNRRKEKQRETERERGKKFLSEWTWTLGNWSYLIWGNETVTREVQSSKCCIIYLCTVIITSRNKAIFTADIRRSWAVKGGIVSRMIFVVFLFVFEGNVANRSKSRKHHIVAGGHHRAELRRGLPSIGKYWHHSLLPLISFWVFTGHGASLEICNRQRNKQTNKFINYC